VPSSSLKKARGGRAVRSRFFLFFRKKKNKKRAPLPSLTQASSRERYWIYKNFAFNSGVGIKQCSC